MQVKFFKKKKERNETSTIKVYFIFIMKSVSQLFALQIYEIQLQKKIKIRYF